MQTYINALKRLNATSLTTEYSFRSALEQLVNSLDKDVEAVNEPKRQACGAPDYVVLTASHISLGYIETKDIAISLDKVEESEQFSRYINALDNLILTNYIEFRRYERGKSVASAVLGKYNKDKTIRFFPKNEESVKNLLQDFLSFPIEPIATAQELAVRMAKLTHAIRETVLSTLDSEYGKILTAWRQAFATMLIPDLMQDSRKNDFADMYAQTIAYGFFAARCHHDLKKGIFERHSAQDDIPATNPLLRSLFVSLTGPDFKNEPYFQFVEDMIQLLALADIAAILKEFGDRKKGNDPVIHFYETFLAAYDPELRKKRGIYYTPEPVVSWLVRSADIVVREKFGISQGLADDSQKIKLTRPDGTTFSTPKVLILDPACGTGTFLYETIDLIRERLIAQGQGGMWSAFVKENLLPRLFGFELLMTPYAVAHFKLGLQLAGYDMPDVGHNPWKYDFSSQDRLRVYLTNTLEDLEKEVNLTLPGVMQILSEEGQAAREVKHSLPVLVIMGNPPYSGESANASLVKIPMGKLNSAGKPILKTQVTMIGKLIEDYKQIDGNPLKEKNTKWLQDDYVKFIRWAQWKLDNVDEGVIAFVTNHAYIDNPTFRGMRYSLLNSFDEIYIYDLHGNARKKEIAHDGSFDKNVFDILQGVALSIMIKKKNTEKNSLAKVFHAEIYGKREDKYAQLFHSDISNTHWTELHPQAPAYLFIPQNNNLRPEYDQGISISELFSEYSTGMITSRDKLTIHFTQEEVWNFVNTFIKLSPDEVYNAFSLNRDSRDWTVSRAQEDIKKSGPEKKYIRKVLYRPFDIRYTYYTGKTKGFVCYPHFTLMTNMINIDDNIALLTTRMTKGDNFTHIQATKYMTDTASLSAKTSTSAFMFPLYLVKNNEKILNFVPDVVQKFAKNFPIQDNKDIFYYVYAILCTPSYQKKFVEFLRLDFPKIPLPKNQTTFTNYVEIGKELVAYSTLTHPKLSSPENWITQFSCSGTNSIDSYFPAYSNDKVLINKAQYFSGVPEEVWKYVLGGYQPLEKWLKDRRGRVLSFDEIQTYQKIVLAVSETILLKKKLDEIF